MTDSAAITKTSQEYKDALIATATETSDHNPVAFADPTALGAKTLTGLVKQNNFLVQISTTILRKLTELEERVQRIEEQSRRIEQGKAAVTLPDDTVQQLIQSLGKGIQLKEQEEKGKKPAIPKTGPILAYKSPFQIYKEELEKLKK